MACSEPACGQRFCEHCLVKHMAHSEGPGPRPAGWRCPICRGDCCCLFDSCAHGHRHCKRYRRAKWRRLDAAAASTAGGGAGGRDGPTPTAAGPREDGAPSAAMEASASSASADLASRLAAAAAVTAIDRADVGLLLDFCQAQGEAVRPA